MRAIVSAWMMATHKRWCRPGLVPVVTGLAWGCWLVALLLWTLAHVTA